MCVDTDHWRNDHCIRLQCTHGDNLSIHVLQLYIHIIYINCCYVDKYMRNIIFYVFFLYLEACLIFYVVCKKLRYILLRIIIDYYFNTLLFFPGIYIYLSAFLLVKMENYVDENVYVE